MLLEAAEIARKSSEAKLREKSADLQIIGTSMSALYQAATCHRKCYGGGHVLEGLAGRTYNLAGSAYHLITRGYYDEALNLIRGIGEICNLISLSVVDKNALREWLSLDQKKRRNKFSPAEVRRILKKKGMLPIYADDDWYSNLCEEYTHVHPGTRPNMHNDVAVPTVGSLYQASGLEKSIGELATGLGFTAMLICKYFEFDDLFDEITRHVECSKRTDPELPVG